MKKYGNTQFNGWERRWAVRIQCIHVACKSRNVCDYTSHTYAYTHVYDPHPIYKTQFLCYTTLMRPIVIHHGLVKSRNDTKLYSCPYYSYLFKNQVYTVPNMKVATALYIYYEIFYPKTRDKIYQRIHPLWRVILGIKRRGIKITDEYSLFLQWISEQPFTTLPKLGRKWYYFKKKEFIKEAQYFITASHKWDWVVPYLRKTYPTLNFGELTNDT